jgi:glycosyltransferase involved in cell wall biosynthesis
MRILMICESFRRLGGVAQIVEELAAEFALAGHATAIASNASADVILSRPARNGVEYFDVDLPRRKPVTWRHPERLFRPAVATDLARVFEAWKPDLANIHGGLRDRFPPVIAACSAARMPIVQSIHLAPDPDSRPGYAIAAMSGAREMVFPSEFVKREFAKIVPEASGARVIRGGFDLRAAADSVPIRRSRPFLFSAARFDLRHKAVDTLVSSFALIADEFPELDLLIAGGGADRPRIEEMIVSAGLSSRIELLGVRAHDELWGYFKAALAFVMLSRMPEGLPLVFFEAMGCGVPVVATRIGGNPELVLDGETGLLVDNRPESIANALSRLVGDSELRAKLGAAAARLVNPDYTWHAAAQHYLDVFLSCVG